METPALLKFRDAAAAADHIWPEYAACEAAWHCKSGGHPVVSKGNNPFLARQRAKPIHATMLHGDLRAQTAYILYPDLVAAFRARMETLRNHQTIYYEALRAKTGEDYVRAVSAEWHRVAVKAPPAPADAVEFHDGFYRFVRGRWSAEVSRAKDVLALYAANADALTGVKA